MSTVAREREIVLDGQRWLDRLLSVELSLNAELISYLGLLAATFLLHFWGLGARALHHDESLHATYSYYLYHGTGYKHDPLMHGPVLFHLTALMYFLFGAADATARFSAAFAGTMLVFTPLLLRRWLGRLGTLAASTLLLVSPAILYYSRFIREDIFVALWTVGFFVGIWRYRQSGFTPWLYLTAGCLALGFANKELTFIVAGVALVYVDVLLAADLTDSIIQGHAEQRVPTLVVRTGVLAALIPVAWAVAALWKPSARFRQRLGLRRMPLTGDLLVVVGTLTLPQLAAIVQVPLRLIHVDLAATMSSTPGDLWSATGLVGRLAAQVAGGPLTTAGLFGATTVLALLLASAAVGLGWNARRWLLCALVFYGIYVCLFTTFFTNPQGFASGIWGSLDYWLAQQDVQRGGQPVFYYLMMMPAYAYLPLALALLGIVVRCIRAGVGSLLMLGCSLALLPLIASVYAVHNSFAIPLVVASLALLVGALHGDPLRQLLATWCGGLLFGLSVAGEKMPWLTIHLEVPLILLAGLAVNDILAGAFRGSDATRRRLLILPVGAALGVLMVSLAAWGPGTAGTRALLFAIALLAAIGAGVAVARRASAGLGLALTCSVLVGLLAPLSLRTAFAMNFLHGDTPYEALVYTQSSPDIPKVMAEIEQYAQQSGQGYNQSIVVDANDAFSWPWAWYLRNYHQTSYTDLSGYLSGQSGYKPPPRSILLLNNSDQTLMSQFPGQFGTGVPYHHRWWFPEDYRGTSFPSLLHSLKIGSTWSRWWGLLADADGIVAPPAQPRPGVHLIGSVDSIAYFPADYVPGTGIVTTAQRVPAARTSANGALTVGGAGSGYGALLRPAAIALDSAANFYIADSQNNRIEKFSPAGRPLAVTGESSAPGGFKEPWGVAVDKQGQVYVADTWNHRIVKLDAQFHFLTAWGTPTKPTGPEGLLSLYGPRAIAFDPSGNLLVTDTGNNRVIKYSPDGRPIASFGSRGEAPGQFQEPVGIAVAPDGTIYVADTWNGRVSVFDGSFQYLRSLPVSGWESQDVENKPYLALLANGDLLLTQPNSDRLLELSPSGSVVRGTNTLSSTVLLNRPIGVATDSTGAVYVSDGANDLVSRVQYDALP